MDLKQLKQKIYDDNNIIPLLESLECIYIHEEQNGSLICAGLPEGFNSTNKRTIQIKNNESLTSYIRSRNISGDIFSIVGYILYSCNDFESTKENLYQIVQYICNTLDYELDSFPDIKEEKKTDWLYFLRDIQKERKKEFILDEIPVNKILDEKILNKYLPLLHKNWWSEGINEQTRKEFDIMYDLESDRIAFSVHNEFGELISIKGRTTIGDERKYIYLYPCYKSIELFNLHRAKEYINKRKKVFIFEGAKSTMLCTQWGFCNCVSIEGDSPSPVQIYKLKNLGIDIQLIFCFDKDKDEKFIKQQLKQIKNRDVRYMLDKNDLLSEKESPVDKGENVFKKLIKNNIYRL